MTDANTLFAGLHFSSSRPQSPNTAAKNDAELVPTCSVTSGASEEAGAVDEEVGNLERAHRGGQTIVVPMDAVAQRLTDEQRTILCGTFTAYPVTPPLASIAGERAVFSFRDMDHRGFPWRYEPAWDGAGAPAVNGAIRALLEAMYDPATTGGIHWA